ncbi:MAG: F0F1 ATP synthase subunit A [Candidatus Saccharimonadales bacterium]
MLGGFFAAEATPLSSETLLSFGPIPITNSILFGAIMAVFTLSILALAALFSQLHPRSRLAYYTEVLVDFILSVAIDSFGNRKKALKHLPLLATLFMFIFFTNLSGLLPGVGTITAQTGGQNVPLLRAFTTDLNATLAMAILSIGLVQFYALRQLGLRGHFKHYFKSPLWHPVNLFIGINEVFGELLRIITLSMRLFGVIYAGEVLLHAIGNLAGNFAWAATVPVMLLEIFFSAIQAYVFMMLTTTYLAIATASSDEHHEPKREEAAKTPKRRLQTVS